MFTQYENYSNRVHYEDGNSTVEGNLFIRKTNNIYYRAVYIGSEYIGKICIVNAENHEDPTKRGLMFIPLNTNELSVKFSDWVWTPANMHKSLENSIKYCSVKVRTEFQKYVNKEVNDRMCTIRLIQRKKRTCERRLSVMKWYQWDDKREMRRSIVRWNQKLVEVAA